MNGFWMPFRRNCNYNNCRPGNDHKSAADVQPNKCEDEEICRPEPAETKPVPAEIRPEPPAKRQHTVKPNIAASNNPFVKSTSLGSIVVPAGTPVGTVYQIASINMQTAQYDRFYVKLCFSCNIVTSNAKVNLSFQMFKRGDTQLGLIPVSCNYDFFRNDINSESNSFSFMAYDHDPFLYKYCNYSVYAKVAGIDTTGVTFVNNSIISAFSVDIP